MEALASVDGPHLVYKNDHFTAPVRNGSDTVWMKKRQIEAMCRAWFEECRHVTEALDALFLSAKYADEDRGTDPHLRRAWRHVRYDIGGRTGTISLRRADSFRCLGGSREHARTEGVCLVPAHHATAITHTGNVLGEDKMDTGKD